MFCNNLANMFIYRVIYSVISYLFSFKAICKALLRAEALSLISVEFVMVFEELEIVEGSI